MSEGFSRVSPCLAMHFRDETKKSSVRQATVSLVPQQVQLDQSVKEIVKSVCYTGRATRK